MKKYKFTISGVEYAVEIQHVEDFTYEVSVNGKSYTVLHEKEVKPAKTPVLVRSVAVPSSAKNVPIADSNAGTINSPLPGTILDVFVKVGDKVKIGQAVAMLEAMKMENNIESDKDGVIAEIKVAKGDTVMEGDVLIVISEAE